MMTITHAITGGAAWLTTATAVHHHIHPVVAGVGTLLAVYAAKAPDIDNPGSRPAHQVNKLIPGLSVWLEQNLGHRGLTHWGITALGTGAIFALLFGALSTTLWWIGLAIGIGWLTHILGDCLTWRGAPLLAPFTNRPVRLPYGLRFQTNGTFERLVIRRLVEFWAAAATVAFAYTLFN